MTNQVCEWDSGSTTLIAEAWHVGQGPAGGPLAEAHLLFDHVLAILGSAVILGSEPPVYSDLGDESAYEFFGGEVWFAARMGAKVVKVTYGSDDKITPEAARDAAHTVLQEVLSRL